MRDDRKERVSKRSKRCIGMFLTALLICLLSACSSKTADKNGGQIMDGDGMFNERGMMEEISGYYVLSEFQDDDGEIYEEAALVEYGISGYLILNIDGTGVVDIGDDSGEQPLTWDDVCLTDAEGNDLLYDYDAGDETIIIVDGDYVMMFRKSDISDIAAGSTMDMLDGFDAFAGDWEGMTYIYDSTGTSGGLGIGGDWIFATFARILPDAAGEVRMDMIGVMNNSPLNYTIENASYDEMSHVLSVSGKVGGGSFHADIASPDENGVIILKGRTSGDITSSFVCYLKKLNAAWERSDAPMIPDAEYNIYVVNNMPQEQGQTIEERIGMYGVLGVNVDMSGFLKPDANGIQAASSGAGMSNGGTGTAAAGTGDKYVYDGKDLTVGTDNIAPANYVYVPYDRFVEGFKALVNGTITTSSAYEDVANAFGDDGVRIAGMVYEGYAYYAWYSDKDYTPGTKTNVLVTFKVSGGNVTYYAYSANGINAQDVR